MKPNLQQVGGRDYSKPSSVSPCEAARPQQGPALCVVSLQTELWKTKLFFQDLNRSRPSANFHSLIALFLLDGVAPHSVPSCPRGPGHPNQIPFPLMPLNWSGFWGGSSGFLLLELGSITWTLQTEGPCCASSGS